MNSFIRTADHLTVVFDDGETATVYTSQSNYPNVVAAVRDADWDRVRRLMIPSTELKEKVASAVGAVGRVQVEGGIVYLDSQALHNTLTDRMIQMLDDGFDIGPLSNFLANLMDNPSFRAVTELYDFMEASDLPITEDGYFIAYKRVRNDYYDIYSGTMDNSIGAVVEMPRNAVDEDKDRTCSSGLHFCSRSYLRSYGTGYDNRTVIVKINPRDVVSIPSDYGNAKGRTCRYVVIGELEHGAEDNIEGSLYDGDDSFVDYSDDDMETTSSDNQGSTARTIEQFNPESQNVLRVFASASAAQSETGVDSSSISKVCRGERRTAGGFGWRYVEDQVGPSGNLAPNPNLRGLANDPLDDLDDLNRLLDDDFDDEDDDEEDYF